MDFIADRDRLEELAHLMNDQSETPLIVTDDLLYVMDAALKPEEVAFLLKMGGGSQTLGQVKAKFGLPEAEFDRIFDSLLYKGQITKLEPGDGETAYHLMTIFPGWFEVYLMRGTETPDRMEFAARMRDYYAAAVQYEPELINAILRDMGPQRSIAVANPPERRLISIDQEVEFVNEVFPPHSILAILDKLDEDETISVGHCFCRQQRKMVGDPCRLGLPDQSCMGLGPAAEHLIQNDIARRISKDEAIQFIKDMEAKGVVHQVGRLVPLKDFEPKYEVDIICNCCWDCCGVIGNYARGSIPFLLKSYYQAEVADEATCTGCGICEQYCPVRAIAVGEEGKALVDSERCCGCGMCTIHCPDEAVHLKPSEREVFLPILVGDERWITTR